MKRRPFVPAKGVSNIELFYDLIFVYCISVVTSLCHNTHGDFPDLSAWGVYMFSFLVVLQVWSYTTLLMNRYGEGSAQDSICLFINMFLLYFLASSIQSGWTGSVLTFNFAWALILVNLIVHWALKSIRYNNLDNDDKKIIRWNLGLLVAQLVVVLVAGILPAEQSGIASWAGLLVGGAAFYQPRVYRAKPSRFSHMCERCALLTIVAFGETIVAIAIYMNGATSLLYPILVFAFVVGLFLIYIYEHDNMIDHNKETDGMGYLCITAWVIIIIGNLTVALELMPTDEVAFLPKSIYLTAMLVLYLLTSFLLVRYNKPEFHYSGAYIAGRIGACVFIVVVALVTSFDPLVNLVCDTAVIYMALLHEWLVYRGRMGLIAFGHSLGYSYEDMREAGYTFETREGRRAISEAVRNAFKDED